MVDALNELEGEGEVVEDEVVETIWTLQFVGQFLHLDILRLSGCGRPSLVVEGGGFFDETDNGGQDGFAEVSEAEVEVGEEGETEGEDGEEDVQARAGFFDRVEGRDHAGDAGGDLVHGIVGEGGPAKEELLDIWRRRGFSYLLALVFIWREIDVLVMAYTT